MEGREKLPGGFINKLQISSRTTLRHPFRISPFWKISLLLLSFLCAYSSVQAADSLVRYEASHHAMGTVFTVVAYGSNSAYLGEVVEEAFQEIDRLDEEMSNYKPQSELSAINREAYRQKVIVNPELFKLLEDSFRYSKESGGAFDITVGPLMKSWGFFRGQGRLPSSSELAQVLKRIGYQHVTLDAATRTIRFDQPGIEIDLGAIAKGYAVDRVVKILGADGIKRALVSSGTSSIYALGSPPDEDGWKVSVRDPLNRKKAACVLRLQNLALSVSGDYEKFFKLGGKTYAHIMDPHTGMPVENMLMTVVVSRSGSASDALSTLFFVEGVKRSRDYLDHHPGVTALFYLPAPSAHAFKQVLLKSNATELPAGSFVKFEEQ